MRIAEGRLRQIIRETLLNEVPIDNIHNFEVSADPEHKRRSGAEDGRHHTSIGRNRLLTHTDRILAKVMFQDIQNSWAIITLSDTLHAENTVKTTAFKEWLLAQNISDETRILVIVGSALPGDLDNINWAIGHDIFGHSLATFATRPNDSKFTKKLSADGKTPILADFEINYVIDEAIWNEIPDEMKLGSAGDRLPDVLLAIFSGKLDHAGAVRAAKGGIVKKLPAEAMTDGDPEKWATTLVDYYFKSVDDWIKSIKPGIPMLISPFSSYVYAQE